MTCAPTGDLPYGAATAADPFVLVQRELADLDYWPADTSLPGVVTYTGPDRRMTTTVNHADRPHHVNLVGLDLDGTPAWDLTFTAATPACAADPAVHGAARRPRRRGPGAADGR